MKIQISDDNNLLRLKNLSHLNIYICHQLISDFFFQETSVAKVFILHVNLTQIRHIVCVCFIAWTDQKKVLIPVPCEKVPPTTSNFVVASSPLKTQLNFVLAKAWQQALENTTVHHAFCTVENYAMSNRKSDKVLKLQSFATEFSTVHVASQWRAP